MSYEHPKIHDTRGRGCAIAFILRSITGHRTETHAHARLQIVERVRATGKTNERLQHTTLAKGLIIARIQKVDRAWTLRIRSKWQRTVQSEVTLSADLAKVRIRGGVTKRCVIHISKSVRHKVDIGRASTNHGKVTIR